MSRRLTFKRPKPSPLELAVRPVYEAILSIKSVLSRRELSTFGEGPDSRRSLTQVFRGLIHIDT
jgi:hypothetical protein